jgi:hypothetical protein
VGNLLLTVLVPLWMFWPLALPLVLGSAALYIPAVLLCTRLFFTGYKIVDRNWGDKVIIVCAAVCAVVCAAVCAD